MKKLVISHTQEHKTKKKIQIRERDASVYALRRYCPRTISGVGKGCNLVKPTPLIRRTMETFLLDETFDIWLSNLPLEGLPHHFLVQLEPQNVRSMADIVTATAVGQPVAGTRSRCEEEREILCAWPYRAKLTNILEGRVHSVGSRSKTS